ncbi:MAG: hypothetical protein E7254_08995 [Lachnospiraceae bacterium]|nr:hypothetical protein [Lachnospiraceae bacterium]
MTINSLSEGTEILRRNTPIARVKMAIGEDITLESVYEAAKPLITDAELGDYLNNVIDDIGYTKSEVIEKANIDEIMAFQIFTGLVHPTFNTLLRICIAAGFTLDETQNAIELAGYTRLNEANKRDEILIRGITYMKPINALNHLLYEMGDTLL